MNRAARPRRLAASLALATALLVAGCSGDKSPPSADPSESLIEPSDAPTLRVEPVTTSGTIVGRLPRKDRKRVEQSVSRVAVRWLETAYLSGRYPRRHFRHTYPGFTGGAARAARHDQTLLSNRAIARRVDSVTPTSIRVRVDLLAVDKRASSATAHVELKFRTTGKVRRHYRVGGRLLLTRPHGHWKIFGYDLSKGAR